MKNVIKPAAQIFCLILLAVIAQACISGGSSLDAWRVKCGLEIVAEEQRGMIFWVGVIALQLVAMQWAGAIWNVLLSLLTIILTAGLVMLAVSQKAAVTPVLYEQMNAFRLGDLLSLYPAALWLVPTMWFIACLCAQEQVRTFCTAIICYGLWLALSAACFIGLQHWQAMDNPPMADILRNFTCCPWLASALPGVFLLLFALLMALTEGLIPRKRHRRRDRALSETS